MLALLSLASMPAAAKAERTTLSSTSSVFSISIRISQHDPHHKHQHHHHNQQHRLAPSARFLLCLSPSHNLRCFSAWCPTDVVAMQCPVCLREALGKEFWRPSQWGQWSAKTDHYTQCNICDDEKIAWWETACPAPRTKIPQPRVHPDIRSCGGSV